MSKSLKIAIAMLLWSVLFSVLLEFVFPTGSYLTAVAIGVMVGSPAALFIYALFEQK